MNFYAADLEKMLMKSPDDQFFTFNREEMVELINQLNIKDMATRQDLPDHNVQGKITPEYLREMEIQNLKTMTGIFHHELAAHLSMIKAMRESINSIENRLQALNDNNAHKSNFP